MDIPPPVSRRAFIAGAIAVPTIAALNACGLSSGNAGSTGGGGGTGGGGATSGGSTGSAPTAQLTIGIGQLAPSVDPHVDTASTSRSSLVHVYDRLVIPDGKGGFEPGIATSWKYSDDLSTLTFTLRTDAKFTNGEPVDATAVKYSLDRQLDAANKAYTLGTMSGKFTGATVVDDKTVAFALKAPDVTALSAIAIFFIVPPKYSATAGMGMGGKGVGSGPMMIDSFAPNDHITLVPNPDYWGTEKVTTLKSVTWLSIEDEAARKAALESGRADVVFPLSPDIWSTLKSDSKYTAYSAVLGQYQTLFLGKYTMDTPMKDQKVRQAISYAIDTEQIASSILGGTTTPLPGQIAVQGGPFFNPNVKAYPHDVAKAKQLLAEAGYPNGFKTTMESTAGRTPADKDVAAAIVQMLADVGIQVQWQTLPATEWLKKFVTGTGAPLFMLNVSMEPSMMTEAVLTQWITSSFTKIMSDKVFDQKVADILKTADDAKRASMVQDAIAYARDAAPVAFLYQIPMLYGLRSAVKGFAGEVDMSQDLSKISIAS
jgi:peptide/nickel transport system substrate-binding protein